MGVRGDVLAPAVAAHADEQLGQEQAHRIVRSGRLRRRSEYQVAPVQGRVPLGVADRPRLSGTELEQHAVVVDHHAAVGALPGPENNTLGFGKEGPCIAVAPVRLGGEEDIEIQVRPLVATRGTGSGRGAEEDQAGDPRVRGGRAHQ